MAKQTSSKIEVFTISKNGGEFFGIKKSGKIVIPPIYLAVEYVEYSGTFGLVFAYKRKFFSEKHNKYFYTDVSVLSVDNEVFVSGKYSVWLLRQDAFTKEHYDKPILSISDIAIPSEMEITDDWRAKNEKNIRRYYYDVKSKKECFVDFGSKLESFSNGFAVFKNNGRYGAIDINGKIVVPFEYEDGTKFQDIREKGDRKLTTNPKDKVAFFVKNGKYGCLNALGEVVIPFVLDKVDRSSEWDKELYFQPVQPYYPEMIEYLDKKWQRLRIKKAVASFKTVQYLVCCQINLKNSSGKNFEFDFAVNNRGDVKQNIYLSGGDCKDKQYMSIWEKAYEEYESEFKFHLQMPYYEETGGIKYATLGTWDDCDYSMFVDVFTPDGLLLNIFDTENFKAFLEKAVARQDARQRIEEWKQACRK